MKALVMNEYKKLSYEEVPTPQPGEGEVLVRLKACSVCGSDVHGFDGSTGRRQPPVIMGHEASGIIEAVGPNVKNYKAGDRVTFDSTVYCNKCPMCLEGKVNLCSDRQVLGVSCGDYNRDGCFAEYVVLPEYILYPIPDNVTYVQASMIEPLSVAYHAATRTPIGPNDAVVVVGVGVGFVLVGVGVGVGVGVAFEAVLGLDLLADLLVLLLELLGVGDHLVDIGLGKAALLVLDGDLLDVTGGLVLSRNVHDTVGVDVEGDFDLWDATWGWSDAV